MTTHKPEGWILRADYLGTSQ